MHPVNWLIVVVYIVYVAVDGIRRTKDSHEIEGYFLAKRSLPWWVVGLSVMATQLSAITMVGTTGQGATDGIRFIQFYFGLPLAMVILSVTLVPFLHGAKVYTAYEYLERRFDARTRGFTSLLFLLSRGMSAGVIISAPAVIFSVIFGLTLPLAVAMIGLPTILYTMFGGVQAVAWADVKQMVIIVFALLAIVVALVVGLPTGVGLGDALAIAGETGRLRAFDFDFSLDQTYTFWSGLIGGTFLMLSYFGTDQSQVQRYLTARSVNEARSSLLMSAYWKIPLQALVLIVGVLVFVYYLFAPAPLYFNPGQSARVETSERSAEFAEVEARYRDASERRRIAAEAVAAARESGDQTAVRGSAATFLSADAEVRTTREQAAALVGEVTGESANDVNYIIPTFVLNELPLGLPGIFIAAVLAAAMSSIAAELNSLSTATIIDFYRRHLRPVASDAHYLAISKVTTGVWGLFACIVAIYAARLGSLIEVVNRFGSFFYGSILGVFMLAMIRRATGRGAFYGLIAGMSVVAAVTFLAPSVSFLWHNVIGAVTVVIVGSLLSLTQPAPPPAVVDTGAVG
jgi:Na+/proline symporter